MSEPERAALGRLEEWGLVDVFRRLYPHEDGSSPGGTTGAATFHKHQGLRIDLILVTESLAAGASYGLIDRNARKGEKPSDHAPVFIDVDVD